MILKALFRFHYCCTVLSLFFLKKKIGLKTWLIQRTAFYFALFYIFSSLILINCVRGNKLTQNESLSPVKHNDTIQGKM